MSAFIVEFDYIYIDVIAELQTFLLHPWLVSSSGVAGIAD